MRILIAGYGNIGKAVETLIRKTASTLVSSIYICDKKLDGISAHEWLINRHHQIDTVINLTGEPTENLLSVCQKYDLDYIDTGLEQNEDDQRTFVQAFNELCATPTTVRAMIGFGMNPGIVEYLYARYRPNKSHVAIELEYDTAVWKSGHVFNTWAPWSYYLEAVKYTPFYYQHKQTVNLQRSGIQIESELTIDGVRRIFNLIPHPEIISIGHSNPDCEASGFFYQAPIAMQRFLQKHHAQVNLNDMESIPTPGDDLLGEDTVGMAIYRRNQQIIDYYFNKANHSDLSVMLRDPNGAGINGTSWQVACGAYVALQLLPHLPHGLFSFTNLARSHTAQIERVLADLSFNIEHRKIIKEQVNWNNIEAVFGFFGDK